MSDRRKNICQIFFFPNATRYLLRNFIRVKNDRSFLYFARQLFFLNDNNFRDRSRGLSRATQIKGEIIGVGNEFFKRCFKGDFNLPRKRVGQMRKHYYHPLSSFFTCNEMLVQRRKDTLIHDTKYFFPLSLSFRITRNDLQARD